MKFAPGNALLPASMSPLNILHLIKSIDKMFFAALEEKTRVKDFHDPRYSTERLLS